MGRGSYHNHDGGRDASASNNRQVPTCWQPMRRPRFLFPQSLN
ncbi:hypothetical protein BIFGAL_03085 [Bifidobacterium gallicum DSM 20093 = LMG 11596]|uniref:Uncharacterized protein n=1 Tax=Bifidobacterium gallicum DSM 20093 = LMG 11596 TaxID=561180 RepID=D1NTC8_9BIFI|nr:hypothetical protein BIFGAL_03085 [Bifidobacterium gallicum DSM 20093 = LMG 11596]